MARPALLAFFGHHKCASTWIHNIVDAVCADAGWRRDYLYGEHLFDGDLAAHVAREKLDWISYVNADAKHLARVPELRGFHMVRDPRDLVVSAYFSHRHSHPTHAWPELVPHRERLSKLDKREGLLAEIEFSGQFLAQMESWDYARPDVLELRQETFTKDPYRGFLEVFRFLGVLDEGHYNKARWLPYLASAALNITNRKFGPWQPLRAPMESIPGERLLGIVFDNRFEKFSEGRGKGKEDVKSHYRKGAGGDWVNHFEDVHVAAFKRRWNDLVLKLGYESDPNWGLPQARASAAKA
jgi:hypothetical protein